MKIAISWSILSGTSLIVSIAHRSLKISTKIRTNVVLINAVKTVNPRSLDVYKVMDMNLKVVASIKYNGITNSVSGIIIPAIAAS